jgi:hypothetical protein
MSDPGRQAHWENVYTTKDEKAVSWFKEKPDISVNLIRASGEMRRLRRRKTSRLII